MSLHKDPFLQLMVPFSHILACLCAQSLQLYLTLCDPMDCSQPGSSVHGVLQARILEWVAMSSPRDFPKLGIKPTSPVSPVFQADSLPSDPPGKPSHILSAAAAAKSLQLCLTLCDPEDHGQPGSSVHGVLQARILEWVAISFSIDEV